MTLQSFPRGGKIEAKKSSNVLLDQKCRPNKKHKIQTNKRNDETSIEETSFNATTAERLSSTTLQEGMIILGRISEATAYELIVSIPGGLLGRVKITDISESYTNMLQNIVDSKNIPTNELKSLPDLYNAGDYVVCYVKSINSEEKWIYSLSLEPQLINQYVDNNYLMKDMKIVCTIKSIEDHGYVVDTGIANVRAFISNKFVDKDKQYFLGNQIFCIIKEVKTIDHVSIVTLLTKRKVIDAISKCDIKSLDAVIPGTKLTLCVQKVLFNGLQVKFGKNNIGYINQIYLDNPLCTYAKDMEVTGTLLYSIPTVKLTYFSLLTDASENEKLNEGDIIKKAKVLYRELKGIVFKLSKSGLRGFISLRRTNVAFAKIASKFEQGSVHKCRILSYNWMEHLYVCTMESNILEQRYFTIFDFSIGDILRVKVTNINATSGFILVQAERIRGSVAPEHVSDSGLVALNKLKVGDSVEARVLNVDNDKHDVKFTLKQSLIKSKLPVLHDICKAQCGLKYHGTITMINKNGLLVRFYGDVKGWVQRTALNNNISDRNWNYFNGQTVTVTVHSIKEDEGKMRLRIFTEKEEQNINISIGELIEGTIIESSITGIHMKIHNIDEDGVVTGFLPAGHMAPCLEIGSLLASKYTPGDVISAYVFATQPSLILSRTYVTRERYRNFDTLNVGDCIPCTIRDILKTGVRVILPIENYSAFGFISHKNISNFDLLHVNQILFVKITAINKRDRQLTLTMSLKDVWESSIEHEIKMMSAVDVLSLYLNKLSELATNPFYKDKPISSAILGQKVTGSIEKITEYGLVLRLDNNLTGVVRKDHYLDNFKVGDKVFGVILWKNYIHDFVDVSLIPRIVNSISSKQKTLPQLPDKLALRGEILMITSWLILVLVKRHGMGYLVALPARRHINDISSDLTPYVIHSKIRLYVIMKRNESDIVPICMLKSVFEIPKNPMIRLSTTKKNKKLKRKIFVHRDASVTNPISKKIKIREEIATNNDVAEECD